MVAQTIACTVFLATILMTSAQQLLYQPESRTNVANQQPSAASAADYALNAANLLSNDIQNSPNFWTINRDACGGAPYETFEEYWQAVYPKASSVCVDKLSPGNQLRFWYAKAPIDTLLSVGAIPNDYLAFNTTLVPTFNSPFIPSFINNCTFSLNPYPKSAWWTFQHIGGVPNYTSIEVMHNKTSGGEIAASNAYPTPTPLQPPLRSWYWYWTPGSGVWFDVGFTISAENKIAMLNILGVGFEQMAVLYGNNSFPQSFLNAVYVPGTPPGQPPAAPVPLVDVFKYVSPSTAALGLPTLLEVAAYGRPDNLPAGFDPADLYQVNRLGSVFGAFDDAYVSRAKLAGYDTVQLTTSPNTVGGWSWEIVYIGGNGTSNAAKFGTWTNWWNDIESRMSVRDPCTEFSDNLGGISTNDTLTPEGPCTFAFGNYTCIYCEQAAISSVCGTQTIPNNGR